MKTQSKTEIRNSSAKATKLLQGIDNEAISIGKESEKLGKRIATVKKNVAEAKTLLTGLSTAALQSSPVPAAKAVKPAKPAAVKKEPAVKVAKAAKPAKVAKAAKPAKAQVKKEDGERPPIKDIINTILSKTSEPLTAAKIYSQGVAIVGYFSRQALYTALKDSVYIKTGDKATATYSLGGRAVSKTSDEEVDAFIEKSNVSEAVQAVV